jgi:SecD/SecF fusion protein
MNSKSSFRFIAILIMAFLLGSCNNKSHEKLHITMGLAQEVLIRSMSYNERDTSLNQALALATREKIDSGGNYIDLFYKAFTKRYPGRKLAPLFAGGGKKINLTDSDQTVIDVIRAVSKEKLNNAYTIIGRRMDKLGIAGRITNMNEAEATLTLETEGGQNVERMQKYLQSSGNVQFWELYNYGELSQNIEKADKALQLYLNHGKTDSANNEQPLFHTAHFSSPIPGSDGIQYFHAEVATVEPRDTEKLNQYLLTDAVRDNMPPNIKFLYGNPLTHGKKNEIKFFCLFAIKTIGGSRAKLEGDKIQMAEQDMDGGGHPGIKMQMTPTGSRIWADLTEENKNRFIAIVIDDVVYSAPNVIDRIEGGNTEISGSFTIEEAQDFANILRSGRLEIPVRIINMQVIK